MFSGIIETKATIADTKMAEKCKQVQVEKPKGWKLVLGESVSVDGICSTVAAVGKNFFFVEYMPETLSKTTAASFEKKKLVNLERSLVYGDRIHGHFVSGHVDTTAHILSIEKNGRSRLIRFQLPQAVSRYVAALGSVAVHGVSLTVARKDRSSFSVALIPHTLKVTNLGDLKEGDSVNIECDMMARYGLAAGKPSAKVGRNAKSRNQ